MSQIQTQPHDRTETTVGTTDEINDLGNAVEAVNGSVALSDQDLAQMDVAEAGSGQRVRRAFTMKNFLPSGDINKWVAANVVSKGVGTHVAVGRIYGVIAAAEAKETLWKSNRPGEGEKLIKSIALSGELQAENAFTGEIVTMDTVFLPMAAASRIARAIADQPRGARVQIDLDIGIESTGKAIPYEWTVTSYLSGHAERLLRSMRNSRRIGQAAPGVAERLAADRGMLEGRKEMTLEHETHTESGPGLRAYLDEGDGQKEKVSARRR